MFLQAPLTVPDRVQTQPKWNFAPVTELEYVSALEAEFWEFESPLGHQLKGSVAQLAAQRSPKPQVEGSSPSWPAIFYFVPFDFR